jgi:putative DNA primase/helicase
MNFGLAPLVGKPLAIISDARLCGANTRQVVERLLSVSGEDMLTVDRKYRDAWTGTLPTRFLVISNELPRFGDASGAIANRFVVLMLSWLGRENSALTAELLPELPGILNWALQGLVRLEQNGGRFTESASAVDAIVALQDLVSPVAAFVRDRCERGAFEMPCSDLYDAWKVWAEDNGHRAGSGQSFGRDLRAVTPGLGVVRPRDGDARSRRYVGVRITPTHNGPDRGPSRTTDSELPGNAANGAAVRDGPKDQPLLSALDESDDVDDDARAPARTVREYLNHWRAACGCGWEKRYATRAAGWDGVKRHKRECRLA